MAADSRLERWLGDVVATPGLTGIRDLADARRGLLEDALRGAALVARFEGPIVDVGSGGGTPGIPLAASLPARDMTLLEANERKCEFLRRWGAEFPNVHVVRGRAEQQPAGSYGVAVAKALAPPPVAAEWTLALVGAGGAAILWVGPETEVSAVQSVASLLGGGEVENHDGLLVLPKLEPTPEGFPRRVGIARKRPLA
jgi:16S rRNA (guanine527-N7)-methyltransferase